MLCFLFVLLRVELYVLGYGKYECFVMQMVYVCVLCTPCGSSLCCILHDLQFVDVCPVTFLAVGESPSVRL